MGSEKPDRGTKFQSAKEFTDCKFVFGENSDEVSFLEARKCKLAMASPVFKAMFYGELSAEDKPILIEDISQGTFEKLLKYTNTGVLDVSNAEEACCLWNAADKYLISDLVERCIKYLLETLTPNNVWVVFEQCELLSNDQLKNRCIEIITGIGGSPLKSDKFENVTKATLQYILNTEDLNIDSEVEVLDALERWSAKECERQNLSKNAINLHSVSDDGIKKIRFLAMTPKEFANGPITSSLLAERESFAIVANLIRDPQNSGSPIPYPVGFSTSSVIRQRRAVAIPTPITFSSCTQLKTFNMEIINNVTRSSIIAENDRTFSVSFTPNQDAILESFVLPHCPESNYTVSLFNAEKELLARQNFLVSSATFAFSGGSIFMPKGKTYTLVIVVHQPGSYPVLLMDKSVCTVQGVYYVANSGCFSDSITLSEYSGEIFVNSLNLRM